MGEIGRELNGLGRSPNNSLMVACGDGIVVAVAHNVVAMDDVAIVDDLLFLLVYHPIPSSELYGIKYI